MTSRIGRAGLSAITGQSSVDKRQSSRIKEIGRTNFKSHDVEGSDDDEEYEGYSIDPSVQLWKSIDFGRKSAAVGESKDNRTAGGKVSRLAKTSSLGRDKLTNDHETYAVVPDHMPTFIASRSPNSASFSAGLSREGSAAPSSFGTRLPSLETVNSLPTGVNSSGTSSSLLLNGLNIVGKRGPTSKCREADCSSVIETEASKEAEDVLRLQLELEAEIEKGRALDREIEKVKERDRDIARQEEEARALEQEKERLKGQDKQLQQQERARIAAEIDRQKQRERELEIERVREIEHLESERNKQKQRKSDELLNESLSGNSGRLSSCNTSTTAVADDGSMSAGGTVDHAEELQGALRGKRGVTERRDSTEDSSTLKQQREELRRMMEALVKEKEEMAQKVQEMEKERGEREKDRERERQRDADRLKQLQQLESGKSDKEREELRKQLEAMQAQNRLLASTVERTQLEAQQQLQKERQERELALQQLEQVNQLMSRQILEAQAKAERQLAIEREELRQALRRMEQEKLDLSNRVHSTEERMAQERLRLTQSLQDTEGKAKERSIALEMQLEKEREELRKRVEKMEQEKREMAVHLAETERIAQQKAMEAASQLQQEKTRVLDALAKVEQEKEAIAQKMAENEKQSVIASQRAKEEALKLASASDEVIRRERERAEQEQQERLRERAELQAKVEQMTRDREELALQLKSTEEVAKQREQLMAETLAREKEELKLTVQRMKEERQAELLSAASSPKSTAMTTADPQQPIISAPVLTQRRSLYDMISGKEGSSSAITNTDVVGGKSPKGAQLGRLESQLSMVLPRTIDAIKEEDADAEDEVHKVRNSKSEKTFMEVDDGDSDVEHDQQIQGKGKKAKKMVDVEVANDDEEEKDEEEEDIFADLPAPHAAAASGDLNRLKTLAKLEPSLLMSVDAVQRTPLFYAAAYNKEEVCRYLVEMVPEASCMKDAHGDTPLHAATSAGATGCLEMLIRANGGDADPRNDMMMSPAHMAKNVDCLEVLFAHGADLTALDINGRSPLFVACAMNHELCAEFILNCLDQCEASLLTKDNRGDTPLHAAACNGSVDCLLMLLQYGIDPRVANAKGLKAIELAIRNKQKKCRDLLAEYHLHYCTSSDFDSVLFLATLEGHKQIKQHATDSGAPYEIIRRIDSSKSVANPSSSSRPTSSTAAKKKGLTRPTSIFSMRNQSMRLQRWGSWIAYEDQQTRTIYYYNHRTGQGQWEKPEKVGKMQQAAANGTFAADDSNKYLYSKASMRLKRVGDWIQYLTEQGKTFFYNEKTGDFRWENPAADPDGKNSKAEKSDWKPYKDPETGAVFWYNVVTRVSQWNCPEELSQSMIHSFEINGGGGGVSNTNKGSGSGWLIHNTADPHGLGATDIESAERSVSGRERAKTGRTNEYNEGLMMEADEGFEDVMLSLAFDGAHGGADEDVVQVVNDDDLGI